MTSTYEVIIVGGGNLGLWTAYHLAQRGQHVAVCEKHWAGSGATSRSAGMVRQQGGTEVVSQNKVDDFSLTVAHGCDALSLYDLRRAKRLGCGRPTALPLLCSLSQRANPTSLGGLRSLDYRSTRHGHRGGGHRHGRRYAAEGQSGLTGGCPATPAGAATVTGRRPQEVDRQRSDAASRPGSPHRSHHPG